MNTNAWSSAQAVLSFLEEEGSRVDCLCLQETRLCSQDQVSQARAWADQAGWNLGLGSAERTGEGPLQTSAGVGVATRSYIGSAPVGSQCLEAYGHRICAAHVNGMLGGGFTLVSLYMKDGLEVQGINVDILRDLGAFLLQLEEPWMVAADWNMEPEVLETSGWLGAVTGAVVAPEGCTCTKGLGAKLDYFVLHEALVDFVIGIEVLDRAPLSPHSPVCLTLGGLSLGHRMLQRVRWRAFPPRPAVGCAPEPRAFQWAWQTGNCDLALEDAWRQWVSHAEQQWCDLHDLPEGPARRPYTGREAGFETKEVQLAGVLRSSKVSALSKEARAWRSLSSLASRTRCVTERLAGGYQGWRMLNRLRKVLGQLQGVDPGVLQDGLTLESLARKLCSGALQRCTTWCERVIEQAARLAKESAAERLAGWTEWARSSTCRGGAAAHRYSRGPRLVPSCLRQGGQPVVGQAAVEVLGAEWRGRWCSAARGQEDLPLTGAQDLPLLEPISLELFDQVCATYPDRLGLGVDCIHPRSFLQLPGDMRSRLIDIMHAWERRPVRPKHWLTLFVFQPKPDDDGLRPIGLTVSILRVWSRIRSRQARQWEVEHDSPIFWGGTGRPCDRAGWVHNLLSGFTKYVRVHSATLFGDIEKFYDHVSHRVLQQEGGLTQFPAALMRALCGFYSGHRAVSYGQAVSEAFWAHGTIIPGCSCATTMAKVLVYRLLTGISQDFPSLHIKNVVDDVSMQALGSERIVGIVLSRAGIAFAKGVRRLGLPLSAKKTVFVATSQSLTDKLETSWRLQGFKRRMHTRNLGLDTGNGRRRRTTIADKRLRNCMRRAARLHNLRRAGAKTAHVHRAGPTAVALWGMAAIGLPPGKLYRLRMVTLKSHTKVAKGSSVALRLTASAQGRRFDPARVHHGEVVLQWATCIWEGYPRLHVLQTCLEGAAHHLHGRSYPWMAASDPACVFLLTMSRLGWAVRSATRLVTDQGLEVDMCMLAPRAVAELAKEATLRWSDREALRRHGGNLEGGWSSPIFWNALTPVLEGRASEGWNQRHRAALVSVLANSHWPQQRQARHGLVLDSRCQICLGGAGTLWHRRYECPAHRTLRVHTISSALRGAADGAVSPGMGGGELFARGIFPDPHGQLPGPMKEAQVHWYNAPEGTKLTGALFTDGSGLHPRFPHLRRAGWAIVQVDRYGEAVAAVYGPVPVTAGPGQVARDGEDYAIMMLSVHAVPPFEVYVDCKGTLECLQSPRSFSTGASNPRAHLWTRYWAAFEGEEVVAHKTLAHATDADIEAGRSSYWQRRGNEAADKFAKLGAACHPLSQEDVWRYHGLRLLVSEAARWAGQQEAALADGSVRDASDLAAPERPDAAVVLEVLPHRPRPPAFTAWEWGQQGAVRQQDLKGHSLRMAATERGGFILVCVSCGAYAWKRTKALSAPCLGRMAGQGLALQRSRVAAGLFPAPYTGNEPLGFLCEPGAGAVEWMLSLVQSRQRETGGLLGFGTRFQCLDRGAFLRAYGLTAESWQGWAGKARSLARTRSRGEASFDAEGEPCDSDVSD